jgi:predicted RNA binding protein YcfA (HicA-like mRNA interferase family)
MPRKIRELIRDLERAGSVDRGGKGNHRYFVHPKVPKPVTRSGNPSDDPREYQEKAGQHAIEESKKCKKARAISKLWNGQIQISALLEAGMICFVVDATRR